MRQQHAAASGFEAIAQTMTIARLMLKICQPSWGRAAHAAAGQPLQRQRGFMLIDIMSAAVVLSIFIAGIGAFWVIADRQVNDLVLRQKAVLVANGEMERLTVIYNHTSFGALGPVTTTGYEASVFPTTRLIYPNSLDPTYTSAGDDYVTTSSATFSGSEPKVWVNSQLLSSLNRSYVWISKNEGVMGRLSWVSTDISPSPCTTGSCVCRSFLGIGTGSCRRISLFVEYPYRLVSGAPVAGSRLESVTLSTIVGRRS
jgi:type II secretory pathway pseudopilin PulG